MKKENSPNFCVRHHGSELNIAQRFFLRTAICSFVIFKHSFPKLEATSFSKHRKSLWFCNQFTWGLDRKIFGYMLQGYGVWSWVDTIMVQCLEEIGHVLDHLFPCLGIKSFMWLHRLGNRETVVSETVFSMSEVEALYELFKRINSVVIDDGLFLEKIDITQNLG